RGTTGAYAAVDTGAAGVGEGAARRIVVVGGQVEGVARRATRGAGRIVHRIDDRHFHIRAVVARVDIVVRAGGTGESHIRRTRIAAARRTRCGVVEGADDAGTHGRRCGKRGHRGRRLTDNIADRAHVHARHAGGGSGAAWPVVGACERTDNGFTRFQHAGNA